MNNSLRINFVIKYYKKLALVEATPNNLINGIINRENEL